MVRLFLFALTAAALAACTLGGPYGYGYAVNERPSLAQLGVSASDAANAFRPAPLQRASAP
ncbi:MAG TPA: hypothetical protein VKV32_09200 [Stellaceae bacterium]|nr:hypothetical protein [Stellaceae bacterium]